MELTDEIRISVPKRDLFDALKDPDVLRRCIPGCESLKQTSPTEMDVVVALKAGPVKARLNGSVTLDTSNGPDAMSLTGEGKCGAAGFARGGADVDLIDDGEGTILRYTAKVQMGGKIAHLGSRLIRSTAKKLSAKFFQNLAKECERPEEAA